MQIQPIITSIEAAVDAQLALAGSDPAVEQAASVLMSALDAAIRQAGMELAEQAAAEIDAQLTDKSVQVVLVDGEPMLKVMDAEREEFVAEEDFDARVTLRLPPSLKDLVESAAGEAGDSLNSWVVKTLSSRAKRSRSDGPAGRRVSETFDL